MTRRLPILLLLLLLLLFPAAGRAAEVNPFLPGSWQAIRAAHADRLLVVHLWSLSCAPCLAELPHWGRLKWDRREMTLVLINTDTPAQAGRAAVALARAGLGRAEAWTFADPHAERLRFEIDRRWQGELPRTLMIAADGTVEVLSGAVGTAPVAAWLDRQGTGGADAR
ncbi:MAG: TlpA family protein disulfide reductase [Magnetospirillum sp.]|nr:TlpA family protein disulfide reductase [Magnetospirillum sp.]